jgi:hypothetical protein
MAVPAAVSQASGDGGRSEGMSRTTLTVYLFSRDLREIITPVYPHLRRLHLSPTEVILMIISGHAFTLLLEPKPRVTGVSRHGSLHILFHFICHTSLVREVLPLRVPLDLGDKDLLHGRQHLPLPRAHRPSLRNPLLPLLIGKPPGRPRSAFRKNTLPLLPEGECMAPLLRVADVCSHNHLLHRGPRITQREDAAVYCGGEEVLVGAFFDDLHVELDYGARVVGAVDERGDDREELGFEEFFAGAWQEGLESAAD